MTSGRPDLERIAEDYVVFNTSHLFRISEILDWVTKYNTQVRIQWKKKLVYLVTLVQGSQRVPSQ
jgi:hypothetical protein